MSTVNFTLNFGICMSIWQHSYYLEIVEIIHRSLLQLAIYLKLFFYISSTLLNEGAYYKLIIFSF